MYIKYIIYTEEVIMIDKKLEKPKKICVVIPGKLYARIKEFNSGNDCRLNLSRLATKAFQESLENMGHRV
jgi:hypothetical protein